MKSGMDAAEVILANIKGETISLDEKIKKSGFMRSFINQETFEFFHKFGA